MLLDKGEEADQKKRRMNYMKYDMNGKKVNSELTMFGRDAWNKILRQHHIKLDKYIKKRMAMHG